MEDPGNAARTRVNRLLELHARELREFVQRRAGALASADDVVQQVAARALDRAAQLHAPERGRAWLFRIARNVLADELRARRRAALPLREEGVQAEPSEPGGQSCRCVLAQVETLKPAYAQLLERTVLQGVPVKRVAAELGITANNAMVRLHRARAALRAQLRAHCGTESIAACLDCICDERGCCAAAS